MDKTLLLLSPDKASKLTKALANLGVANPLQVLCDEAAAEVARLTTGYVIADLAVQGWVRSLALASIYSKANVPPPDSVTKDATAAATELQAIAKGERPNLPKVANSPASPNAGSWGSGCKLTGRIGGQI